MPKTKTRPRVVKDLDARLEGDKQILKLDNEEREAFRMKELANQALVLFTENAKTIPEISKEMGLDLKVLHEFSISPEFPFFREAVAERASEMYLDTQHSWNIDEIANALGMTKRELRSFTKQDVFLNKYRELFTRLDEDPTPRAVQTKIIETALPKAYEALMDLLDRKNSPMVRFNAVKMVIELAGIQSIKPAQSDRAEAAKFLSQAGIHVQQLNVIVPPEYQDAMKKYLPAEDGEFSIVLPTDENIVDNQPETDSAQQIQ